MPRTSIPEVIQSQTYNTAQLRSFCGGVIKRESNGKTGICAQKQRVESFQNRNRRRDMKYDTAFDLASRLLMKSIGKYETAVLLRKESVMWGPATGEEIAAAMFMIEEVEDDALKEQYPGYKQILDVIADWRQGGWTK